MAKRKTEKDQSRKREAPSLRQWVYEHFGIVGLAILSVPVLIGGVLGFYEHWRNSQTLPLVHKIVCWCDDWAPKAALPKADPKRFSVAIAHFENDEDESLEGDLKEALSNFDKSLGIEPLEFDRLICLQGHHDDAAEAVGKKKAQQYLAEAGADVLVWGVVRDVGGKNVARVYVTTSEEFRSSKKAFAPKSTEQAFDLPEDLRSDISDVLSLAIVSQSATFYGEGQFVADKLAPFVDKVRTLIQTNSGGLNGEALSRVRVVLAEALYTVGEQTGVNQDLEEARDEYLQALVQMNERESPLEWATTQNNLGTALTALGKRKTEDALVCDGLRCHVGAWQIFSVADPYHASIAAAGARKDIILLKILDPSAKSRCLPMYAGILKQMNSRPAN